MSTSERDALSFAKLDLLMFQDLQEEEEEDYLVLLRVNLVCEISKMKKMRSFYVMCILMKIFQ